MIPILDGVFLLKNFQKMISKNDFKKLKTLLIKLGMAEDLDYGKLNSYLLKKGFKGLLYKKHLSTTKRNIMMIKENLILPIRKFFGIRIIKETHTSKNKFFSYSYIPNKSVFTAIWKSNELSGKEFMSILLSNH